MGSSWCWSFCLPEGGDLTLTSKMDLVALLFGLAVPGNESTSLLANSTWFQVRGRCLRTLGRTL